MKRKVVVLFVLGMLSGAVAVMMCGCNAMVGAVAGAGEGAVRDVQTGWRYATHRAGQAEDYTRDQDQRLR